MMLFEYDVQKSQANMKKHGIDFVAGQKLWEDPNLLVVEAKVIDEKRFLAVGVIDKKHWSAVFTPRKNAVRIISIRRARKEEVVLYESKEF